MTGWVPLLHSPVQACLPRLIPGLVSHVIVCMRANRCGSLPQESLAHSLHIYVCSVFLECVDGGTLEWNAQTNKPVYFHKNITGYISAAPADDRILITDSDYNWVTALTPRGDALPPPAVHS